MNMYERARRDSAKRQMEMFELVLEPLGYRYRHKITGQSMQSFDVAMENASWNSTQSPQVCQLPKKTKRV